MQLSKLGIKVSGEQAPTPPWVFEKFHIHYEVAGVDVREKDVERAITLSEEKYCSVSATLRGAAKITWDYEIVKSE